MSKANIRIGCLPSLFALLTAIVGNAIHGSIFWTIMDFIFWPIAIFKWVIFQEINISIIKTAFSWFFQ